LLQKSANCRWSSGFILFHSSVIYQGYDKDIFSSKEQTAEEPWAGSKAVWDLKMETKNVAPNYRHSRPLCGQSIPSSGKLAV